MVAISQCSTGFRDLTKDPLLYATVDLRQVPVLYFWNSHDDDDDSDDDDGDDDDDGKDGSDDFNFNESDSSDVYIMMVLL